MTGEGKPTKVTKVVGKPSDSFEGYVERKLELQYGKAEGSKLIATTPFLYTLQALAEKEGEDWQRFGAMGSPITHNQAMLICAATRMNYSEFIMANALRLRDLQKESETMPAGEQQQRYEAFLKEAERIHAEYMREQRPTGKWTNKNQRGRLKPPERDR